MANIEPRKMPRWVRVFVWTGILAAIVILVMLASGHGPMQHLSKAGMN